MMRLLLAALVITLALSGAAPQPPDCRAVQGWAQKDETRSYEPDNLFDYMNGNAEGYLLYRFQQMVGVTCQSGADTILIDISVMADAESAYGIFSANRHPKFPVEKIGMGGQIMPRKATFAKGPYYIELAAEPEKDHTPALRAFVAALEKVTEGETSLPAPLGWFPPERLSADSVRLVPESLLGLRILSRGYVAEYEYGKGFVVTSEKTPQAAAAVLEKWKVRIGQTAAEQVAEEAFTAEDKFLGRLFVFRKGRYLAGFANLAAGEDGKARAQALAARIP